MTGARASASVYRFGMWLLLGLALLAANVYVFDIAQHVQTRQSQRPQTRNTTVHHQVNCPSGLSFVVRKYKGKEANLFTNKQLVRQGGLISAILDAVCIEVLNPGPYTLDNQRKPPWDRMLTGDRITALIESRIATYGSEISFPVQCSNELCRERWTEDLDMSTQLKRRDLSEESKSSFVNGNRFETYLIDADGVRRACHFHLLTGTDEQALMKLARRFRDKQATASVLQRIDDVEKVHKNDLMRLLEEIDLDEMTAIVDRMDEYDCGVDTKVELECPECGNLMEYELPLGGKEFFLPKPKKSTSTTATATS